MSKSMGLALQPQNMGEAMQAAEMLAGSQMVPAAYKGKPQDVLVAMMMGAEIGLHPIQSIQNIAVINGRPSMYGDALAAVVQNHPSFGGMEEDFNEKTMTASCTVWREGGNKHTQTFSQQDAQAAGLWGKKGPWVQYPKRMLQMRARGFALRSQFADALLGLISTEEAQDMPTERDITPQSEPLQNLPAPKDRLTGILESRETNYEKFYGWASSKYEREIKSVDDLSDDEATTIANSLENAAQ